MVKADAQKEIRTPVGCGVELLARRARGGHGRPVDDCACFRRAAGKQQSQVLDLEDYDPPIEDYDPPIED